MHWHPHRRFRPRLHRRLFAAFGAAITVTAVSVGGVFGLVGVHGPSWRTELGRVRTLTAQSFARVWDDPAARSELAATVARDLDVDLTLSDARGQMLGRWGQDTRSACRRTPLRAVVVRDGMPVGGVTVCADRHQPRGGPGRMALALFVAWAVLWGIAGKVARRLSQPLSELVRVVQDIGNGRLSSRVRLPLWRDGDEVGGLSRAVYDMAERIERSLADQRELLAAVSHEIRSPLARMRFALEMLRDGTATPAMVDTLERELLGIDALVGDLLASSRVDFGALSPVALEADEVARRAIERAGADPGVLTVEGKDLAFVGDATLLVTAVANLLDNARRHGGAVERLRVSIRGETVVFEVDDRGQGFGPGEERQVFEPFYRGGRARGATPGTGRGLALVKRIAEAHNGRAYAQNRPEGGARVGIELARAPA